MRKLGSYAVPHHYISLNNFWVVANRLDEKHLKTNDILLKNCENELKRFLIDLFFSLSVQFCVSVGSPAPAL